MRELSLYILDIATNSLKAKATRINIELIENDIELLLKIKDNIRDKYGVDEMRNAIHSSDSNLNVYRESKIYFATPKA